MFSGCGYKADPEYDGQDRYDQYLSNIETDLYLG